MCETVSEWECVWICGNTLGAFDSWREARDGGEDFVADLEAASLRVAAEEEKWIEDTALIARDLKI